MADGLPVNFESLTCVIFLLTLTRKMDKELDKENLDKKPDNSQNKAEHPDDIIHEVTGSEYKYGFTSDIDTDIIPVGLSEDVIRLISAKKEEPEWLLEFRLKAYRKWLTMKMPTWAHLDIPPYRLPSHQLLRCAQKEGRSEIDGRCGSRAYQNL